MSTKVSICVCGGAVKYELRPPMQAEYLSETDSLLTVQCSACGRKSSMHIPAISTACEERWYAEALAESLSEMCQCGRAA